MVRRHDDESGAVVVIGMKPVGADHDVYVVAEAGINHLGNMDIARTMVFEAARAGADAIKFQSYVTEKRVQRDSPIFAVLKQSELSEAHHRELIAVAEEHKIEFISTAFDLESVEMLFNLHVAAIKIASFDVPNRTLLRELGRMGKPIILSTGMSTLSEVQAAVSLLDTQDRSVVLLHCVSAYPLPDEAADLSCMRTLKKAFPNLPVGYSDHTQGWDVPTLAVAAGACIIEKHFIHDPSWPGPDRALSLDPSGFRHMVERIRHVTRVLGTGELRVRPVETEILRYRRIT